MNTAHVHLLLNHFPFIGLFFALFILVWGLKCTKKELITAGLVMIVLSGIFATATYFTGDSAERVIKNSSNFSKSLVDEHEEAAEFAIWSIAVTAVSAAAGLYFSFKKNHIPKLLMIAIVLLHVFSLIVVARTNYLGGKISHQEIR